MIKLFFDIETVPCEEDTKDIYIEILKKRVRNAELSEEEIFKQTALEGTFGRICCIGYIKEDGKVEKGVIAGDERDILRKFWEVARGVHRFIGHNIWEFDLPFIYKRSIISGVRPRLDISFARYRNLPIYDTQQEWELWGFGKAQKLDTLAKVLHLPTSKDEMDGSQVWDYYQQGKIDDICRYCMKDVELTRQVYYKMTFEEMPDAEKEAVLERQREYIANTKVENQILDTKSKPSTSPVYDETSLRQESIPHRAQTQPLDEALASLFSKDPTYEEKEFDF